MEKISIILDSGAYSAWRSGKPIDLDKYCDYLLANLDWITHYVALDVINPGNPEEAAKASFENYNYMRKRGLDPMPVFHVGEDISWLERMLEAGATYIGLSASSLVSRNQVDDWYSLAWSHLTDRSGVPIIRAHAFGEGRQSSLVKFPWQSADSTSWIYTAQRTGQITLPSGASLSMRNDGGDAKSSPDLGRLSEVEQAVFDDILSALRIDRKAFEGDKKHAWAMRAYMTAFYFLGIQNKIRAQPPIRHNAAGFFFGSVSGKTASLAPFDMYLVCSEENASIYPIIAALEHSNILVSYFYLAKQKDARLKEFVADPRAFVMGNQPWAQWWDILQEYRK